MSSTASTVPGDGRGHRESNTASSSSNTPGFTSQLPEGSSVRVGIRPVEEAQDRETAAERHGQLNRTRQNIQEKNQSNSRPSSSSNRPNTRSEADSNSVIAAHSSSRPQAPLASQSRSFAQGDTTSPNIREQRAGADEPIAPRVYPSHRSNEEREGISASSATGPMNSGRATSNSPAAASQEFMRPSPRNAPIQSVNMTPINVVQQANPGAPQRPPQRPGEFVQATRSNTDSEDGGNVHASTVSPARNNDAGGRVPYTANPPTRASQDQNVSKTAPAASRAPSLPLPASQPNRSGEQRSNDPYSSYIVGSARAGDQPGSDLTTMGSPPVPQPRHPATQNVNTIPTYRNPWAVDNETPQRRPQPLAGFDQANMGGSSGDRIRASDLPATTLKNEPVFQVPHGSDPAVSARISQSATSAQSHKIPNSDMELAARRNITDPHFTAPVVSGNPSTVSQPNRGEEQKPNSSTSTRGQFGSDSAVRTISTPLSKPPAPEPQNPSTQNVNAIPTLTNPWAVEIGTSQRPPQHPAGFDRATTSGRVSGNRELAPKPSSTTTRKTEHPAQEPYGSNPAAGTRMQSSKSTLQPGQSDKEKSSAPVSSLLSSLAQTKVPDHASLGSTVTSATVTLESLMAKHKSLDLTSDLTTQPGDPAHGGLADVHEGSWRNKKVAVKVLRNKRNWRVDSHSEPHITTMMPIWATLEHQNICKFLGYSTKFGDYPALISTWCEGGNSLEYLRNHPLRVARRIRLAQGVAEGLQYLHSHKIVHGDLTPTNILVDENDVVKLCDIGLTRLPEWQRLTEISPSPYTGGGRYRAPELFITPDHPYPVVTSEGDIYSLGCVMLKFIEQFHPFERFQVQDVKKQILSRNPPALRESRTTVLGDMANFFWNQLEGCWDKPSRRPRIEGVVNALDKLANNFPLVRSDGPQGSSKKGDHPPPYSGKVVPASAAVDKITANYGSPGAIPPQGATPTNFSLTSAVDVVFGGSSMNSERDADYVGRNRIPGSSLHTGEDGHNVGGGRNAPSRSVVSGGRVTTVDEPSDPDKPTTYPPKRSAHGHLPSQSGPPTGGSGHTQTSPESATIERARVAPATKPTDTRSTTNPPPAGRGGRGRANGGNETNTNSSCFCC